ncbi:MAG: hypothetical protein NTW10_03510 [Bacteroidetes bacterium]|nr:hypothetical protein [Bacteroidota bacterium]
MRFLSRFCFPLFFFVLAEIPCTFAQRFDHEDKLQFADTIRTIKVWTYIEGDSSYRRYRDAVNSIAEVLNKKGYRVDFVVFEKGKGFSPQEWMNSLIFGLRQDEAFLQVATQIKQDTATGPSNDYHKAVTQPSGQVLILMTRPAVNDSLPVNYFCKASSYLYINWQTPGRTAIVPVYSRKQNLASADLFSVVTYSLGGIPSSKHPVVSVASQAPRKEDRIHMEITLFGGYTFPSKMDIVEGAGANYPGVASFNGGVHYGIEAGFSISRNFDFFLQYRRLGSVVNMNTPEWGKAGPLTLYQNYILPGVNFNFRVNKTLSPYAGITAGTLNIVPDSTNLRDYWYFILGAQAGLKIYLSKWIGLRIQADLLYQMHTDLAPFLFTDILTDTPVNATSNMIQAGISAGLIIRLGEH